MLKAEDILQATARVTKKWAKQRKAEERSASARANRRHMYSGRVNQTDVAWRILPAAYMKASAQNTLPANQRQIYYAARDEFYQATGRALRFKHFCKNILLPYCERSEAADWRVTRDPRGNLREPHTNKVVPIGTLAIDEYLSDSEGGPDAESVDFIIPTTFPTCGPMNRYQALLYIEKEGFGPLFAHTKLAERFDIAIMSCKGQSVIAARKLVDEFCHDSGIPLLVLHDLDPYGFSIFQCIHSVSEAAEQSDTVAYRFKNDINAIDLGLRLEDVKKWGLKSEHFKFKGGFDDGDTNITQEEMAFLRGGQRVELNSFTSEQFVEFVEGKLRAAGITEKLIPDSAILLAAYRRSRLVVEMNDVIAQARAAIEKKTSPLKLPKVMRGKLRKALKDKPEQSWDAALYDIVRADLDRA